MHTRNGHGWMLKGNRVWFIWLILIFTNYHNDNNEVKMALLMYMLFGTEPFVGRNNRKYINCRDFSVG